MEQKPPPPTPPVQVPNWMQPTQSEEEKKVSFLQRVVAVNIFMDIVIFGLLFFIAVFVVAFKFDLIDYFAKKNEPDLISTPAIADNTQPPGVINSKTDQTPSIFINEQGVDIHKIFSAPADPTKLTVSGSLKKEVFGFLPYWMVPALDQINTKLFTSISYFGLEVDGDGNVIKMDSNGVSVDAWSRLENDASLDAFIKTARKNRVKFYVTLKCFNQSNIEKLTTSEEARKTFIANALYIMNSKSLDGINIDFEYIGTSPAPVTDGFSILIRELNGEMKRALPSSVLTVDTFVDAASYSRIHDIPILVNSVDGLVIMGYDFHTPNSGQAGPVAPIEGSGLSLQGLLSSYLDKVGGDKLILAVPYYGYDWPTSSGEENAAITGSSADVRILPYAVISDIVKGVSVNWDENSQTPWYSYVDPTSKGHRVVHFENVRSLGVKYDYINQKKLQGVAIWAMGFDGKRNDLNQLLSDKFAK